MIQISLEVPDRPGELSRVVKLLGDHQVDIKALYLSRTNQDPPKGQVRMIVTDPSAAVKALRDGGWSPIEEKVVVVALEDYPGGMARALMVLTEAGINLDYVYGFVSRVEGRALSILGTELRESASDALRKAGFALVDHAVAPKDDDDPSAYLGGVWNW